MAQERGLDLVEVAPGAATAGLPHHGFREIQVSAAKKSSRKPERSRPSSSSRKSRSARRPTNTTIRPSSSISGDFSMPGTAARSPCSSGAANRAQGPGSDHFVPDRRGPGRTGQDGAGAQDRGPYHDHASGPATQKVILGRYTDPGVHKGVSICPDENQQERSQAFRHHRQRQVQAAPAEPAPHPDQEKRQADTASGPGHAGRFGQRQGRQEAFCPTPSLAVLEKYGRIFQGTGGDF